MRTVLFLGMILWGCVCGIAQEFKAASLWDAYGDVKEIKYSTKDPLMVQKKMKFDRNGKLKNSVIVYNADGYPLGLDMNMGMIVFISLVRCLLIIIDYLRKFSVQ